MRKKQINSNVRYPGLAGEELVPLSKACDHFPVSISIATLQRYWRDGIRGNRLATILLGGRRYTSVEEISRWISRSTGMPEE